MGLNPTMLVLGFILLMIVTCGIIAFVLRWVLMSSTESSVERLGEDLAKLNTQKAELNKKLQDAEEELKKKKSESDALSEKIRSGIEEEAKAEREKVVSKAREEAEEILAKAQTAREKMRLEMEKEIDMRAAGIAVELLNQALSQKAKSSLGDILIDEFIQKLQSVDMQQVSSDVKTAEVITLTALDDQKKSNIAQIIKGKLNRDIAIETKTDEKIGGGVIIRFGSMTLDGSIQNVLRETGIEFQKEVESR